MAETKTTITEEVKNEIPRAVTQNSILTIEVDASIESTQEKEEAKWHQNVYKRQVDMLFLWNIRRKYHR